MGKLFAWRERGERESKKTYIGCDICGAIVPSASWLHVDNKCNTQGVCKLD